LLKKTIKDVGYSFEENANISGRWINEKADIVMNIQGNKEVGFRKNEKGVYDLVGDFYGKSQDSILAVINQRYFVNSMRSNMTKLGVKSITEQVLEDGSIKLRGIRA